MDDHVVERLRNFQWESDSPDCLDTQLLMNQAAQIIAELREDITNLETRLRYADERSR